jgi:chromosomal replication initiation ATPase DnaA
MTPREARLAIVARVAAAHGVAPADVLGRSRLRHIARARQQAVATVQAEFGYNQTQVARLFGLDRTTVWHALRRQGALSVHKCDEGTCTG